MDANQTEVSGSNPSDRKATLLNLLKFSGAGHSSSQSVQEPTTQTSGVATPETHSRTASALAGSRASPSAQADASLLTSANPQEKLLKLLNRGSVQPVDAATSSTSIHPASLPPDQKRSGENSASNVPASDSKAPSQATTSNPPPSSTIFNFVSPFDHLSLERNTARFGSEEPSSAADTNSRKILTPKSPTPRLPDGRTQVEALLGIGARKSHTTTSVPEAVNDIAQQASKQAQESLERAAPEKSEPDAEPVRQATVEEFQKTMKEVAKEIKQELNASDGPTQLEKALPAPIAEAFKETINEMAKDGAADSWESADSTGKDDASVPVRVYDFPMRPFVSIALDGAKCQNTPIRQDCYSKVASFKKEFDQQDRVLTTATPAHIIYALAKGGGYRVIQQEDGSNKQVFKKGDNPIYNISIASPKGEGYESILAASTNGSVYYSETPLEGEGALQQDLDKLGFIFPPLASQEDISSTTQLKTRAKLSTFSPRYFAVARGKSIHFVWPKVARLPAYLNNKTRIVNSEKYLKERCQKIGTGKASKDFTFSVEDTVLASIDKTGRLKFWDIREHTNFVYDNTFDPLKVEPVEAKTPLMMLQASSERAGASPTSVIFLDKEKTYTKKIAQRYVLVGLKQNHTLQLWDLHLGKAVQELNFPHGKDEDAFCSVAFHPQSSMIVVGHPTRNSIFYVQLSAPKYTLKAMSQVDYVIRCAQGGGELPRLESTAIMTGLREVSMSSLGQLRSLDVMSVKEGEETDTVFELYIMHSRGVSYASIKPEDLGWNKDRKSEDSIDAEGEGVIAVSELVETKLSENAPESAPAMQEKKQVSPTKPIEQASATSAPDTATNSKKKKAKQVEEPVKENTGRDIDRPVAISSYANAAKSTTVRDDLHKHTGPEMKEATSSRGPPVDDATILSEIPKPIQSTTLDFAMGSGTGDVVNNLSAALNRQFETLYTRLDDDKRIWEASSAAKQDAILRLVSSTLADNVEKSLARIVNTAVQTSLPQALSGIGSNLEQKMSTAVSQKLDAALSRELGKVATKIENELSKRIQDKVVPAIREDVTSSVQKTTHALEHIMKGHLREYELARQADHTKIDQLVAAVQALTTTHAELEAKIAKFESSLGGQLKAASSASEVVGLAKPVEVAPQPQTEVEILHEMMAQGKYEEVFIKWLQSPKHEELFDDFFYTIDPEHLKYVNHLVSLSVIPDVSASFATHLEERLNWLDAVLTVIDISHNDTAVHAKDIMVILVNRLQTLYFQIMESDPDHRFLNRVHSVMRAARDLVKSVGV